MNRIAGHIILYSLGFLAIIKFESCCRYNESYHVSDYGKSWITYAGSSVSFINDSGETVLFDYSPASTSSFKGSHGEECGDYCYIDEIIFSLTGLSIFFKIDAENSCYGSEILSITCNSSFLFGFSLGADTIYSYHPVIYHDHILINGQDFQKVYEADSLNNNLSSLVKCYLTKDRGIVGYETAAGRIWCLQ